MTTDATGSGLEAPAHEVSGAQPRQRLVTDGGRPYGDHELDVAVSIDELRALTDDVVVRTGNTDKQLHYPAPDEDADGPWPLCGPLLDGHSTAPRRWGGPFLERAVEVFPQGWHDWCGYCRWMGAQVADGREESLRAALDALVARGDRREHSRTVATDGAGGFHSAPVHEDTYRFEEGPEPGEIPDPDQICYECADEALDQCGSCGIGLCGRHNEVQGGFCSEFTTVAGDVPACVNEVWGVMINPALGYDEDVDVVVTPGSGSDVFHVPVDDDGTTAPLCRPEEDAKERRPLASMLKADRQLCELCEGAIMNEFGDDEGGDGE